MTLKIASSKIHRRRTSVKVFVRPLLTTVYWQAGYLWLVTRVHERVRSSFILACSSEGRLGMIRGLWLSVRCWFLLKDKTSENRQWIYKNACNTKQRGGWHSERSLDLYLHWRDIRFNAVTTKHLNYLQLTWNFLEKRLSELNWRKRIDFLLYFQQDLLFGVQID